MAIRDFGESLLADVRKRKDAQAKAASPSTLDKALQIGAEIIPLIGNRDLSQSLNDFKQNEEVLRLNLQAKQAEQVASYVDNLNTSMADSDFEGVDYFINAEAQKLANQDLVTNEDAVKFRNKQQGADFYLGEKTAAYSKNLEVRKRAEEAYKNYQKASEAVTKYRASGTREDAVELAKATRPSKGGAFINRLTGRGTEAITSTMVEDFVNSTYGKSTQEASSFYALLKNSNGDFIQTKKTAEEVLINFDEALENAATITKSYQDIGDGKLIETESIKSPDGSAKVTLGEVFDTGSEEDLVRKAISDAGLTNKAALLLNRDGHNAFLKTYNPNPKTLEDVNKNIEAFDSLYSSDAYRKIIPEVPENTLTAAQLKVSELFVNSLSEEGSPYQVANARVSQAWEKLQKSPDDATHKQAHTDALLFRDEARNQALEQAQQIVADSVAGITVSLLRGDAPESQDGTKDSEGYSVEGKTNGKKKSEVDLIDMTAKDSEGAGANSDTTEKDSEEKQLLRKLSLVAQAENRPTLTLNTKSRSYQEAKKAVGDIQDYKDFINKIAEQSKEALEAKIKNAPYTSRKTYRDKLKAVSLNPSAVLFKDFEGSTPLAQDSLLASTTDA